MGQEEDEKKTKKEKKDEEVRRLLSPAGCDRLAGRRPQRDIKWLTLQRWLIMSFYAGTRDSTPYWPINCNSGHKLLCSRHEWPWRYVTRRMRVVDFGTDRRRWTAVKWTLTWLLLSLGPRRCGVGIPCTNHKRFLATTWCLLHFLLFQLRASAPIFKFHSSFVRLHNWRWNGGAFATKN